MLAGPREDLIHQCSSDTFACAAWIDIEQIHDTGVIDPAKADDLHIARTYEHSAGLESRRPSIQIGNLGRPGRELRCSVVARGQLAHRAPKQIDDSLQICLLVWTHSERARHGSMLPMATSAVPGSFCTRRCSRDEALSQPP